LFDAETDTGTLDAHDLGLDGGDAVYFPRFLSRDESDRLLANLDETTVWRHETIKMYGKEIPIPRLSAWHGDPGRAYTYSHISMQPETWTDALTAIRGRVEAKSGTQFNSVLVNLYRHGQDSVAWHSDDEEELGEEPVIASVKRGSEPPIPAPTTRSTRRPSRTRTRTREPPPDARLDATELGAPGSENGEARRSSNQPDVPPRRLSRDASLRSAAPCVLSRRPSRLATHGVHRPRLTRLESACRLLTTVHRTVWQLHVPVTVKAEGEVAGAAIEPIGAPGRR